VEEVDIQFSALLLTFLARPQPTAQFQDFAA
jgi:hypothetical protein